MSLIEERVLSLEKRVAGHRNAAMVLGVVLAAILLGGATTKKPLEAPHSRSFPDREVSGVIRATGIEVVDDNDIPLVILGSDGFGNGKIDVYSEASRLAVSIGAEKGGRGTFDLLSDGSHVAVQVTTNETGGGALTLNAAAGHPAVFAAVDESDRGFMGISSKDGIPVYFVAVDQAGHGSLGVYSGDGHPLVSIGAAKVGIAPELNLYNINGDRAVGLSTDDLGNGVVEVWDRAGTSRQPNAK